MPPMRNTLVLIGQILDVVKASGCSAPEASAALSAARQLVTVEPVEPVDPAVVVRSAKKAP